METKAIDSSTSYEELWIEASGKGSDPYFPEKYQLGILAHFLHQQDIHFITEGRVFCYPIDVLAMAGESTIAIELKSRNIGRGIDQARRNSDFVDFSFLSVWEDDISEDLIERVSQSPVGLLGIESSVQIYSTPANTEQQLCSRDSVIDLINDHVRSDGAVQ